MKTNELKVKNKKKNEEAGRMKKKHNRKMKKI